MVWVIQRLSSLRSHLPVGVAQLWIVRQHAHAMWTCPKCKENIEDQFDSCWKCAGAQLHEQPPNDSVAVWMYPVASFVSLFGLSCVVWLFWHSSRHAPGDGHFDLGGALAGIVMSAVGIWAFFRCPMRHWIPKLLTFLLLIPALFYGVFTVGSFIAHVFGYDAA